ncbi:YkgJ family cysteine cluster protein [Pontibacter sp. MBLB2868]|uniref:YkgJ family cysteine cluster protein n=1 Tax=Pontibacter sp. MBLB2868 TaxID=3451555 RepID=UPI003F74F0A6
MSDSSNLCLSCGLCCEGTVIGFVQLDQEELPQIKKLMDIEEAYGIGFFLQPCAKFCNGCTIYANRPKQCAKFKCGLLTSFEQKKLDFATASEMIKKVIQLQASIEKKLEVLPFELRSQSFYFKMVELNNLLLKKESESLEEENHADLRTELNQLNKLLSEEFEVPIF